MRPIRYVGRHRNAGHGYPLRLRLRREAAYWLRDHGAARLGYLVDFDRDRFAREDAELPELLEELGLELEGRGSGGVPQ